MADDAPAPRAASVRLDGRSVDITSRALVVGVLDGAGSSEAGSFLTIASEHVAGGADMLALTWRASADDVAVLRAEHALPIGVETDDLEEARDAFDAGATLVRAGAPPTAEYLDAVAVRDGALLVTDPTGDHARLAASCGLDDDQIVLETGPDGRGDRALVAALCSVAHSVVRAYPVAFAGGNDLAAVAWAVQLGARLVYTRDVAPVARVTRTFAAIAEAGSDQ
ncbi:MAG TPA: hypothetical protein VGO03_09435 [Acidimicrobiia bacterium]